MRRRWTLVFGAVAALAAVAIAAAASAAGPDKLTIAVYGDPNVQEVVHVGDIHSGSEPCTRVYDLSIFGL